MKKKKKINYKKIKKIMMIGLSIFLLILIILLGLLIWKDKKNTEHKVAIEKQINEIKKHYNNCVKTNKQAILYEKKADKYVEIGSLASNLELKLSKILITEKTKYFPIDDIELNYYIYYKDVDKKDTCEEKVKNKRYTKYIVFNENIITKNITNFYDSEDNLVYSINKNFNFPIIIKDKDRYGIEYNDELLYIKKSEVKEVVENNNTPLKNSKGIPVLNYHFVYEKNDNTCNEIICHSEEQIISHFAYIKDNNYFTPTMKELEMYIDGKLQLPEKSVVITFDDGVRAKIARKYVDMYELNATLFLITSWFSKDEFESDYMEVHSHGDNLHNAGVCPGGQGGAIKCLEKDKLLVDLKESRSKLNNTTVFCYPFYEYNQYSIDVLKEAGYTMAFAGEYASGKTRVTVGCDKFRLPRWVIVNYTSFDLFKDYIG